MFLFSIKSNQNCLADDKEIRFFSLGSTFGNTETAIVFVSDFEQSIRAAYQGPLIGRHARSLDLIAFHRF
jgi:hypothetical protein